MTKILRLFIVITLLVFYSDHAFGYENEYDQLTMNSIRKEGFFNFYYDDSVGKIYLDVSEWKKEFLYLSFLAAGVGSNDLGLDRGKFKEAKVVRFERYGPRVLLIQSNYRFRAESENLDEQRSVDEAFAQSVLGGFTICGEKDGKVLIDISEFIVRDEHNLIGTLKNNGQGSYSLDKDRSVIFHELLKNFPLNSEFEAILTFNGISSGSFVREVVPSPESVTVRQHHSFVALPDDHYRKRAFDPRSGYINISYMDYATPIEEDITKRFIRRHRLEKKNPNRKISEPVKPIIYYVDPGAPEPIRSALIEGASWWNEAFEAAGFKNAFQVKVLPEGADPLDVRYNVIQWVHRSTRGWSYGFPICDPRTGEIIKGHVSLGSLRARQDYLIAQGLLAPFKEGASSTDEITKMALARLSQLSAHEVGHTIGLAHNYIASTYNRGSVMDYPHPLIKLDAHGNIDVSNAYETGIGAWDKVAILYGYSEFSKKQNETTELKKILQNGIDQGIIFLSDQDARPYGSAHPNAHLWDNGKDAADELENILKVREIALANFSENNIPVGKPMAQLEEVLVPIYFLHRYQTEAAVKVVGGLEYSYAVRGDGASSTALIDTQRQQKALDVVLKTIRPDQLALDESIIRLIPPKPLGYARGRENIESRTGVTFDALAAAETAAKMTMNMLLYHERCARLVELHARNQHQPSLEFVLNYISDFIQAYTPGSDLEKEIQFIVHDLFIDELIHLAQNSATTSSVRAVTRNFLMQGMRTLKKDAYGLYLISKISKFFEKPTQLKPSKTLKPPDGSPIGIDRASYKFPEVQCTSIH